MTIVSMKNKERWCPTKIVRTKTGFKPSPDRHVLHIASRLTTSRQIEHYQSAINRYASGQLLDTGCGYVPYYEMYKSLVHSVICVDWPSSLHKNHLLDMAANLNDPLPFAPESFDTVLLTDVLEHIFRPVELVSEIARILRPGGNVIIAVPFLYWLHEQPHDYYRYTEFALRQMCDIAGLAVVSLAPYGGALEVLVDISAKCMAPRLPSLCGIYIGLLSAILRLKPFRSMSDRTARLFPLGYVAVANKK